MKRYTSAYVKRSKAAQSVCLTLSMLLLRPSLHGQQAPKPTSELIAVIEHYDKCVADEKAKNVDAARTACERALDVLKNSKIKNDEATSLRARLEQVLGLVRETDRTLDRKVRALNGLVA